MRPTRTNRRDFLKRLGVASAVAVAPRAARTLLAGEKAKTPPNILLIMADDVGREVLGCYGGTSYRTANLDRLAKRGIRFTHCYSCPVCSPSRVKIMTGRYGFRTTQKWGYIPPKEITFGHVLKKAGYATAIAGKWQMCLLKKDPGHVGKMGFDESCVFGWHEGPRYHDPFVYWNGKPRRLKGKYGPDVYCEFLIDFMTRNKDRPFLAYYSMALCHAISDDFKPPPPPAPNGRYQRYDELVAVMDKAVGRVVSAVEKLGLRERTVVLFTGDNGTPRGFITDVKDGKYIRKPFVSRMGDKVVRGGKGRLTDLGTRVPLIASWPGTAPAGTVCDDLIDFSDFLPTLAELAGAELPQGVTIDGRSFAPRLRGREGNPREWCFNFWQKKAWARTKRWKLYRSGKLYDVANDPAEKKPIDPDKQSAEAAAARKKLQAVLDRLKA